MKPFEYDRDYYEFGVESGKSNYSCYRWLPELTIPMAMTMIDFLHITNDQTILDWGAAKGYLVKAFRWLRRQAWGYDISEWAIQNADPEIRMFCSNSLGDLLGRYDVCMAKDVLEHIPKEQLGDTLSKIRKMT